MNTLINEKMKNTILFIIFFTFNYLNHTEGWVQKNIKKLNMLFSYPSDFHLANIDEIPIEHVAISGGEDLLIFANLENCKFIHIKYEDKKGWGDIYNYAQTLLYRRDFYKAISDSILILMESDLIIQENRFVKIEMIYSPKFESDVFYIVEVQGRTNSGYDFHFRYKVYADENIDAYIEEANAILEKIEFY